jgi:membrane-bound serine protease (ClpP class)
MLVGAGFVLIAAEIFIPGGILGLIGVLALVIALAILGFVVFGASGGLISAIGSTRRRHHFPWFVGKILPDLLFRKWFTLKEDGRDFKSFDEHLAVLLGKTGTAYTDLRPAGTALIDDQKYDVMSESGYITRGTPIKVIHAAGNRVVVRAIPPA